MVEEKSELQFELLLKTHDRKAFDCGVEDLNTFLQKQARKNQQQNISKTWVLVEKGSTQILGYYTISIAELERADLPEKVQKKLPLYPIPIARIGRFATDLSVRGQGLGGYILLDALHRIYLISEQIGLYGIDLHAKDKEVKQFYRRYGFETLEDDDLHLYLPIKDVRELFS